MFIATTIVLAVVGLVTHLAIDKLKEIGLVTFGIGLFFATWSISGQVLHLGK